MNNKSTRNPTSPEARNGLKGLIYIHIGNGVRILAKSKVHKDTSKFTKNWLTKKRTRGVVAYQIALLGRGT